MEAHEVLSAWWRATGDAPEQQNAGEAAVQEIERRYGLVMPDDFRAYLVEGAPTGFFHDTEVTTWWSPSEIKTIPEGTDLRIRNPAVAARGETYLLFADFIIWSSAWAICCDGGPDRGKVVSVDGVNDRFVAASFTAFVEAYVADANSVS